MSKKKEPIARATKTATAVKDAPDYTKLVILALRKIMQSLDAHSHQLLKGHDVTVPQVMCLYELFEKGATTVAVLAHNVHLSASTIVGVIDRLEEKKLVTRTRGHIDRRSVFVNITAKGRKFVTDTPNLLHNRLHDSLYKLDEKQQFIIADSLETLVQMLKEK